MCDSCREDVTSNKRCTRCGKIVSGKDKAESFTNPNFDKHRFKLLSNDDFDEDLSVQLKPIQLKEDGDIAEQ